MLRLQRDHWNLCECEVFISIHFCLQLGLLKREAERQRLLREDIEMESQKLNNHIFVTQSALEESNTRNAEELKHAISALQETERCREFPHPRTSSS